MSPASPSFMAGRAHPEIGLGLAALGRPSYINLGHGRDVGDHPDRGALRAQAHAVLDEAWSADIRYFDAARSYGLAEQFLAEWLIARGEKPAGMVVASKWGYTYTADWRRNPEKHEVKDHSATALDRQLSETRALLGDRLDLYQIHSATLDTGVLDDPDVIERLRALRHSGLAVGLSTSGPNQRDTIHEALAVDDGEGELLFDAVQATWNLLERSAAPALAEAAAAGVKVVVKEAMANGRLGPRGDAAVVDGDAPWGPDAVALAAALSQPWVAVVLSGAATTSHLTQNTLAHRVPADVVDRALDLITPEPPDAYWSHRAGLAWT